MVPISILIMGSRGKEAKGSGLRKKIPDKSERDRFHLMKVKDTFHLSIGSVEDGELVMGDLIVVLGTLIPATFSVSLGIALTLVTIYPDVYPILTFRRFTRNLSFSFSRGSSHPIPAAILRFIFLKI